MNRVQKIILTAAIALIAALFIYWAASGMEIFTKTGVMTEKTDELFGTTYKEWEEKFIPGLEYTALAAVIIAAAAGAGIFLLKDKNRR